MTREEIIIGAGVITGLVALIYFERQSGTANMKGDVTIPSLVAPVATDNFCIGKTDADGNWYGINASGDCTIEALGGSTGSY